MEKSSFFNSVSHDRTYKAEDWAEYFASFIGNGVFPVPSTGLQIMVDEGMTITVKSGKAWINGYFYYNTSDLSVTLDTADGQLNRIDRIVLRWDLTNRVISIQVKSSSPATSPTAPVLQRDANIYEIALADITVGAGIVAITQSNITDQRLNTSLCGVVAAVVNQIDTATFNTQLQTWFAEFQSDSESEFQTWFDNLGEVLDENAATNLLNMINAATERIENLEDSVWTIGNMAYGSLLPASGNEGDVFFLIAEE